MPPLWLVFLTTLAVVALLAAAAYHLINAIQASDWAWPWQRRRRRLPELTAATEQVVGDFASMAKAVGEALSALQGLIEYELHWRDWLDGVEIRWWPRHRLTTYRPYDREEYEWPW